MSGLLNALDGITGQQGRLVDFNISFIYLPIYLFIY